MFLEVALLAVAGVLGLLYVAATWQFDHWRKKGVPHLKPRPFIGNIGKVLSGKQQLHEALDEAYHAFPDAKLVGIWTGYKPTLLVQDLDIAKHILIKDWESFVGRGFRPDKELEPQAAHMMFTLQESKGWRALRNKLSPVFTSGKMKLMFPLMVECSDALEDVVEKEAPQKESDNGERSVVMSDLNSRLVIDVITSCAFGCAGKALTDKAGSVMYNVLNGILNFNEKQGRGYLCTYFGPRWLYRLMCRLGSGMFEREKLDLTSRLVEAEVEQRDLHGKTRADALGLSLQLRDKDREAGVPRHESVFEGHRFTAISLQFLIAGTETTSSTLNFALYEMAIQPELQARLRSHIRDVVEKHGGSLCYEAVHEMELLDRVINETLRLYPIVPFLDRICCTEDYLIPDTGVVVEKGTMVFIPVYSIQRDPKYFQDPESFDPDRWLPENGHRATKDAFLAFGAGPRYCIGNRFAMSNAKAALSHILLRYEVLPTPEVLQEGLVFNRKSFTINLERDLRLVLRRLQSS